MDWHHAKEWLTAASGLDMDALHVHAGVLIQIGAALLLRRRLSSPIPWLIVLAFTAANEIYDYRDEAWPDRAMQRAEGYRDAWNTMLIPTLLMLLARFAPRLFTGPSSDVAEHLPDDPG
jgi:hypothetical protein